jgi:hypothetical protein
MVACSASGAMTVEGENRRVTAPCLWGVLLSSSVGSALAHI